MSDMTSHTTLYVEMSTYILSQEPLKAMKASAVSETVFPTLHHPRIVYAIFAETVKPDLENKNNPGGEEILCTNMGREEPHFTIDILLY